MKQGWIKENPDRIDEKVEAFERPRATIWMLMLLPYDNSSRLGCAHERKGFFDLFSR